MPLTNQQKLSIFAKALSTPQGRSTLASAMTGALRVWLFYGCKCGWGGLADQRLRKCPRCHRTDLEGFKEPPGRQVIVWGEQPCQP